MALETVSPSMRLPLKMLQLALDDIVRQTGESELEEQFAGVLEDAVHKVNLLLEAEAAQQPTSGFRMDTPSVLKMNTCWCNPQTEDVIELVPAHPCPAGRAQDCVPRIRTVDERGNQDRRERGQDQEKEKTKEDEQEHDEKRGSPEDGQQAEEEKDQKMEPMEIQKMVPLETMRTIEKVEESGDVPAPYEAWQHVLIDMFKTLDSDHNNRITRDELLSAMKDLHLPSKNALEFLEVFDSNQDGYIERKEWVHVIESGASPEIEEFAALLEKSLKADKKGLLTTKGNPWYMISCRSGYHIAWDIFIFLLLVYIATGVPFSLAFSSEIDIEAFSHVDTFVDVIFAVDIILNFQTSYISHVGTEVFSWRKVAKKYLRTWFMVDLLSTVPYHMFIMWSGNRHRGVTHAAKLMKTGKLCRAFKLLRLSKLFYVIGTFQFAETFEEFKCTSDLLTFIKVGRILSSTVLLCHWLACGMVFSGKGYLINYFSDKPPSTPSLYLAALYWSMTTMTTVGYGDITPASDSERAFAMVSMVVGGSYYGFVIGEIASIITSHDLYAQAYYQRMDLIMAWIYHHHFPPDLRRRLRHYFRAYFGQKSAIDEAAIMNDLSADLREECRNFLIHDHVRHNPMFDGLPSYLLRRVVQRLKIATVEAQECIIREDTIGTAMHIIIQGVASLKRRRQFQKEVSQSQLESTGSTVDALSETFINPKYSGVDTRKLGPGDSFGEEILLGFTSVYSYSVTAVARCDIYLLEESDFDSIFQDMPEIQMQMCESVTGRRNIKAAQRRTLEHGKSTLRLQSGTNVLPTGFVEVVLGALEEINTKLGSGTVEEAAR